MAHLIPSDITQLAMAGGHSSELDTLQLLHRQLSNDFTVFHSVHWTQAYASRTRFGEIDFVILNRSGDVLLIEQKNGALEETDRGLVKHYRDGSKNAVEQLHRSVDGVRQKFRWQHGSTPRLDVDYLVYCPDHHVQNLNAVGVDGARIVDSGGDLAARIETTLGPGVVNEGEKRKLVHGFFCQSYDLVPDVGAHISHGEKGFVRQVGALAELFRNLEMAPYRLRVLGTAGCGKSVLARCFFERETAQGRRPLLLCFNRPLSERFRTSFGDGGYINTWYGFCHDFLVSRGIALDFADMSSNPHFWRDVQERVVDEEIPKDWRFDALIVDEGQDFEAEWWEIVQLFLADGAPVLWLEDRDQNLYDKEMVPLPGFVGYRARVNYRSPERIARFIRSTLPFQFESGNELPGQGVSVHGYEHDTEQPAIVENVIKRLLKSGFSHDDIALITCRSLGDSTFSDVNGVGSTSLRRFTGSYDEDGTQTMSSGQLLFDSIRRFKGQDAPAVVLVDIEVDSEQLAHWFRLLYCGMTRATVRLELVVKEGTVVGDKLLKA